MLYWSPRWDESTIQQSRRWAEKWCELNLERVILGDIESRQREAGVISWFLSFSAPPTLSFNHTSCLFKFMPCLWVIQPWNEKISKGEEGDRFELTRLRNRKGVDDDVVVGGGCFFFWKWGREEGCSFVRDHMMRHRKEGLNRKTREMINVS